MFRQTVLLVVIALAAITTSSSATEISRCADSFPDVNASQVSISGCDAAPCVLQRNSPLTVEQKFVPLRDIHYLITVARITISGWQISWTGPDGADACNLVYNVDGTKASCPLRAGTEYIYRYEFLFLNKFATGSSSIRWSLSDGEDFVTCFKIAAVIV